MSSIQQILASILNAVYGKDVRQAIHDGVEMAYNKADDAATSAAAAAEAASGSQESAAASAQAASNSASSASDFADAAEQYKNEAFHTTPAGYEAFVGEVNSSLDYLINTGVKNLFNISKQADISSGGLSFTNNSDGTVTVSNGTTTGEALYPSASGAENGVYADLKPSTKYKVSFGVPLSTNYKIQVYYQPTSSGRWTFLAQGESGDEFEFTTPSQIYYVWIRFRIAPSVTVSNLKLYPMVRLAESDDKTFQPYAQSNAALTENISEVNSSLDDLFNTNVKNILPNKLRPETNSGITVTLNDDDGSVTLNGTATADHNFPVLDRVTSGFKLPQGNYRLSGCPSGGSTSTYWVTLNYSKSGTTGGTNFADDVGNGADFTVSSTLENDPNFSIGYLIRVKSGTVCNNLTFKPMVTKKNVPNSDYAHYVPFVQTNLVLTKYQNGLLTQKTIEASTIDDFLEDAMTDLVSRMENLQFKVAEYLWSGHLVFVFQIFKYDSTNAFGISFRYDKLYLITLINGTLTYKEFATVS